MRSQKSTFKYWKNLRKQRRWKLKRRHFWWFTTTVFYSSSGKMKIWSLIFASVGALIRWLQELRRLMLETFATGRVQIFCAKRGERKQLNLIFRLTTLETDGCCCFGVRLGLASRVLPPSWSGCSTSSGKWVREPDLMLLHITHIYFGSDIKWFDFENSTTITASLVSPTAVKRLNKWPYGVTHKKLMNLFCCIITLAVVHNVVPPCDEMFFLP